MQKREKTKKVKIGSISIGHSKNVVIQSMCNTKTYDVKNTVSQILKLEKAGCEIVRVSVPDEKSAASISDIKKKIHIPLVADIHFDYRLALMAIENGIDKARINPGNIGSDENIKKVVDACKKHHVPIRIGVNSGSLSKNILKKYHGKVTASGLFESARENVRLLEKFNFDNIVVSIKSSDVLMSIDAYRMFADKYKYPLHIGITESGTLKSGNIKSSIGLGILLHDGIGDTMRVSLSTDPIEEIYTAKKILEALDIRKGGIEIVSCPTCARTSINIEKIASIVEDEILKRGLDSKFKKRYKVAIMGCVVNGPGEAKESDIGIAGGDGLGLLFKKGKVLKKINEKDIVKVLLNEIEDASK